MSSLFTDRALSEAYDANGYIIFDLLDDEKIKALKSLFDEHVPVIQTDEVYESSRHRSDETNNLINDTLQQVMQESLAEITGENEILGGSFFVKSAGSQNFLHLHQDWSIVEEDKFETAFIWCALQDTDASNGGLFILPESHLFFNNRKSGSLPSNRLTFNDTIRSHTKDIELKAGQAIIYSDNLFHGSYTNPSEGHRVIATGRIMQKGSRLTYYHRLDDGRIGVYYFTKDTYLNGIRELAIGQIPDGLTPAYIEENNNTEINEKTVTEKLTGEILQDEEGSGGENGAEKSGGIQTFFKTYTPANIIGEIKYRLRKKNDQAQKVGKFYDQHHQDFIEVYGELIQAFRTTDISKILDYEFQSIGFKDGMTVLDAGCGVCRPAIHFAKKAKLSIKALSISQQQIDHANALINNVQAKGIETFHDDYHRIEEMFPNDHFDKAYFLVSFGHSTEKDELLQSLWKVLKPGGEVYIKDLFIRKTNNTKDQKDIHEEVRKINKSYHYQVAELSELLDAARKIGFILVFAKTIDIKLEDFENLTISNKFQELTGIYKIESFDNYIFPVEFLEIKLYKPAYNLEEGKDRYFLQNLLSKKAT